MVISKLKKNNKCESSNLVKYFERAKNLFANELAQNVFGYNFEVMNINTLEPEVGNPYLLILLGM